MNYFNLLRNALNYKDKIIDEKKFYQFEIVNKDNDLDIPIAKFYNEEKKYLFSAKIQLIGVSFPEDLRFQWSWSLPDVGKNMTYLCRKILKYGIDLDINDNLKSDEKFNKINLYIKSLLINSIISLDQESKDINLEILESLILYITKSTKILNVKHEKGFTEYLALYDFVDI